MVGGCPVPIELTFKTAGHAPHSLPAPNASTHTSTQTEEDSWSPILGSCRPDVERPGREGGWSCTPAGTYQVEERQRFVGGMCFTAIWSWQARFHLQSSAQTTVHNPTPLRKLSGDCSVSRMNRWNASPRSWRTSTQGSTFFRGPHQPSARRAERFSATTSFPVVHRAQCTGRNNSFERTLNGQGRKALGPLHCTFWTNQSDNIYCLENPIACPFAPGPLDVWCGIFDAVHTYHTCQACL